MAGGVVFVLLAILNCGGYRYGASDQAFYIPAILLDQDPTLFPRDRVLLAPQAELTLFDNAVARLSTAHGGNLPALFFIAFLAGLVLLWIAATTLGRLLYASAWTTASLGMALTLRHRIPKTGANTLEGYLHPRMVAFALGVWALTAVLRGRQLAAVTLLTVAALFHPTTAGWFVLWAGTAALLMVRRRRSRWLAPSVAAAALITWWLTSGPLRDRLEVMDDEWVAAIAGKDYFFPTEWPPYVWAIQTLIVTLIAGVYMIRRRRRLLIPGETGLVAGSFVLLGAFLCSLPFIAGRVALAVQLQTSRVFWMIDLMATVYLVWLISEAGAAPADTARTRRPQWIFAVLLVAALTRGLYVMFVEHPHRAVVQVNLPADEWHDAMSWLGRTPADSHVLADPGHAWRYGTSVRIAAARDVYLEEVKDSATAVYSREVARRVVWRIQDAGDLRTLPPSSITALAHQYDLDYFVTDRRLPLPVAYRNGRFTIYSLQGHHEAKSR